MNKETLNKIGNGLFISGYMSFYALMLICALTLVSMLIYQLDSMISMGRMLSFLAINKNAIIRIVPSAFLYFSLPTLVIGSGMKMVWGNKE